jgi:hypothetical protein
MKLPFKKRLQALVLALVGWPWVAFVGMPILARIFHQPVSPLASRIIAAFIATIMISLPNATLWVSVGLPMSRYVLIKTKSAVYVTAALLLLLAIIPSPSRHARPQLGPWIPESMPSIECKCDIRVEPAKYFNPKIHRFLELDSAGTTIIIDTHANKDYRDLILDPADTIWPC